MTERVTCWRGWVICWVLHGSMLEGVGDWLGSVLEGVGDWLGSWMT